MGSAAGEHRQRDRAEPVRELARRRLSRRGDDADHGAPVLVREPELGGDYRGDGNAFEANGYDGLAEGVPPVRHDHISSAREG
jgi:hypothetical protein